MEEKTAMQEHQERVNAIQAALNEILKVAGHSGISFGGKLTGKDSNKSVVMMVIRNPTTENEASVTVTRAKPAANWIVEYNNATNAVLDTTVFKDGVRQQGKIHFTRPELSCIEGANNLLNLIQQVHEWKPTR